MWLGRMEVLHGRDRLPAVWAVGRLDRLELIIALGAQLVIAWAKNVRDDRVLADAADLLVVGHG